MSSVSCSAEARDRSASAWRPESVRWMTHTRRSPCAAWRSTSPAVASSSTSPTTLLAGTRIARARSAWLIAPPASSTRRTIPWRGSSPSGASRAAQRRADSKPSWDMRKPTPGVGRRRADGSVGSSVTATDRSPVDRRPWRRSRAAARPPAVSRRPPRSRPSSGRRTARPRPAAPPDAGPAAGGRGRGSRSRARSPRGARARRARRGSSPPQTMPNIGTRNVELLAAVAVVRGQDPEVDRPGDRGRDDAHRDERPGRGRRGHRAGSR